MQLSLPLFTGLNRIAEDEQAQVDLDRLALERQSVQLAISQRIRSAAHVAGAAALVCALIALPGAAQASSTQEAMFMDDNKLVYGNDQEVEATFAVLRTLGVDSVRVSVLWHLVAPQSDSASRPAFAAGGPSDPAAYPSGAWDRYDRVVNAASRPESL